MKKGSIHFKKLCTARMGYTFRTKPKFLEGGNVCVIQPKDVSADGVLDIGNACRTMFSGNMRLNQGDVLLINRGRFTATVFNEKALLPCVATSAFIVITPKDPEQLLPEYLALFYNSSEGQMMFRRLTETTTIPYISLNNLASIKIPVPALKHQKVLVEMGEVNRTYLRLCVRKVELQQQIIDRLITPTITGSTI